MAGTFLPPALSLSISYSKPHHEPKPTYISDPKHPYISGPKPTNISDPVQAQDQDIPSWPTGEAGFIFSYVNFMTATLQPRLDRKFNPLHWLLVHAKIRV